MNRGSHASSLSVVSLALVGAICWAGCTVGYQPQPVYSRPVYYAPPPRSGPPPQQGPYYASYPSSQGGPSPQGGPPPAPQGGPCIDPGPRDIPARFDQAMPLDAQSQTVGCMVAHDYDMFAITVPAAKGGQIVHVSMQGSNNLAPRITMFDVDRKQVAVAEAPPAGELRAWAHVASGTLIYLRAEQANNVTATYTLTLTTEPLADADEPDNDMEHATPVHEGTPVKAFMSAATNETSSSADWYRVEIPHDGIFNFDIDMVQGVEPQIDIFDADRKSDGSRSGQNGEHVHFNVRLRHGLHYVKLSPHTILSSARAGDLPVRLERQYTFTVLPGRTS